VRQARVPEETNMYSGDAACNLPSAADLRSLNRIYLCFYLCLFRRVPTRHRHLVFVFRIHYTLEASQPLCLRHYGNFVTALIRVLAPLICLPILSAPLLFSNSGIAPLIICVHSTPCEACIHTRGFEGDVVAAKYSMYLSPRKNVGTTSSCTLNLTNCNLQAYERF